MMHKVLFAPRVMLACFLALCYTQELRMNLLLSCIKVFGDNLEKKKPKQSTKQHLTLLLLGVLLHLQHT